MSNPQTIADRINFYLETNGISRRSFCIKNNLQTSSVNRQLKGESTLSSDTLQTFVQTYPDVNLTWLLMGTGSMYADSAFVPCTIPGAFTPDAPDTSAHIDATHVAPVPASTPTSADAARDALTIADALAVIRSQQKIIDYQQKLIDRLSNIKI